MKDAFERRRQVSHAFQGRIAANDRTDPGYANYENLLRDGYRIRVFLNEVEQSAVLIADPNQGIIERFRMIKGRAMAVGGIAQIEIVKGNVTIKLER